MIEGCIKAKCIYCILHAPFSKHSQTCLVQVPQKAIVQDGVEVLNLAAMEGHYLAVLSSQVMEPFYLLLRVLDSKDTGRPVLALSEGPKHGRINSLELKQQQNRTNAL